MDKTRMIKMALLGVLVFGLGVGLAVLRKDHAPPHEAPKEASATPAPSSVVPDSAAKSDTTPSVASSASSLPAAGTGPLPGIEAGKIIPEAPEMPPVKGALASAAPASSPPTAPSVGAKPTDSVAGAHIGGPFILTDQKGNEVTEKSWPGKYKLVFFGFTQCPDTCPQTLQKIKLVMQKYDPKAEKLQPLFITTDPANDTRDVMATYMGGYAPVLGLTGTAAQIEAVEKAYGVYVNGPDHSAYIYLMSPDDKPLEVLGAESSAEDMIAKIKAKAG
jgi:protein SCO1/2